MVQGAEDEPSSTTTTPTTIQEQNSEMLQTLLEISAAPDFIQRVRIVCNRDEDLIRPETDEDPTRRG